MAGALFPQGRVGKQLFDEAHGDGWRLVTVDPDAGALDPGLAGWFASIGGAVVDVADTAPELTDWFGARGVRWALQRPDFHLFGAATDVAEATLLLDDLRHQLSPTHPDRSPTEAP